MFIVKSKEGDEHDVEKKQLKVDPDGFSLAFSFLARSWTALTKHSLHFSYDATHGTSEPTEEDEQD
ncbi:hypothetical protein N7448_000294 [Penicillium atrosanguineum]|nr:hypothetical protein N7448_000294 [Penicillium atrosanguineum]